MEWILRNLNNSNSSLSIHIKIEIFSYSRTFYLSSFITTTKHFQAYRLLSLHWQPMDFRVTLHQAIDVHECKGSAAGSSSTVGASLPAGASFNAVSSPPRLQ